jgi:8-oxo-dGTP pyrophosphatase MutT (NUDIX family)
MKEPLQIVNLCIQTPDLRKTLLINRIKEPYQGYWGMPGGKIKSAEIPRVAAERELFEETGIIAKLGKVDGRCHEIIYENGNKKIELDIWYFQLISDKNISHFKSKEGELRWVFDTFLKSSRMIPSDYPMMQQFSRGYSEVNSRIIKNGPDYKLDMFWRGV